jgi:hypothetical protein
VSKSEDSKVVEEDNKMMDTDDMNMGMTRDTTDDMNMGMRDTKEEADITTAHRGLVSTSL